MSGGGAPPAPDYVGAAQATAQGNLEALQYQTQANRVNQVGPDGSSSTWTQSAPSAANNWTPQWTQTTTLNPEEEAALAAEQKTQAGLAGLGQGLEGNVESTMSQPFNGPSLSSYMSGVPSVNTGYSGFGGGGVPGVNTNAPQFSDATAAAGAKAAYGSEMNLLEPQMEEQAKSTEDQLRLQGLTPGTEAYDNAMRDMNNSQTAERTQAADQAVQTGNEEANRNYSSELAGFGAGNEAQAQDYGQALSDYGTGQQAITNANEAQGQEFGQGQQGYETAYGAALNNYLEPLQALSAVQGSAGGVSNPSFPNYFTQGYAPGPNLLQAANERGAYNSNVYSADQAAQGQEIGGGLAAVGTIAAIAL